MSKQEFSLPKLSAQIQTEADAYLMLEELRWGGAPTACPLCGVVGKFYFLTPKDGVSRKTRTGSSSQRRVWKCAGCRKQFSVLTGTIFHGTKISIRTWLMVIFEFVSSKNSVSAWEISRKYEITNETAWHMLHRIREAMKMEPVAGLMRGTIIEDETWIGGKPGNWHADKRKARPVARGGRSHPTDKQPVMALVNYETREVRSRVVPDVTGRSLSTVIDAEVDKRHSQLWTDENAVTREIGKEFNSHHGATTNAVEGYFSQLKRSIDGTHHAVSVEHLQRYLHQMDFMYSHCKETDSERMRAVVSNVGGRRLTYLPLTGR